MYEGYLELGGYEVINSARAVGYARTADCPVGWLVCPPCDGIRDVIGSDPYTYGNISQAPWYDEQDEPTHRFLGVHGIRFEGIPDSTREASVEEGVMDGGVVGRVRNATRRVRVEAMLTAIGEDALEVGFSWLNSALTPGRCGTHGDACGAADARFYAACPPTRAEITTPVPVWNEPLTNLVLNPSMETAVPTGPTAGSPWTIATGTAGTMRIVDTGTMVEFWITCSDPLTTAPNFQWGGIVNGSSVGGVMDLQPGFAQRMLGTWPVATAQQVTFSIPPSGTQGLGGPMVMEANVVRGAALYTNLATNPSFETAGSVSEVVQATNLITNPSMETTGVDVEFRRNLHPNPRALTMDHWNLGGPFPGAGGTRTQTPQGQQLDTTGLQASALIHPDWMDAVPNSPYVGSFEVNVPSGFPAVTLYVTLQTEVDGGANGPRITINPGETKRVGSDVAPGVPSGRMRPVLWAESMPAGGRIVVRNALYEKSAVPGPYFDGSKLPADDWTYLWAATPDASDSVQYGKSVTGYPIGQNSGWAVSSTEWAGSRTRSLRVISNGTGGGNSFAQTPATLVAGKTYTVQATLRQDRALGNSYQVWARAIYVEYNSPAAGGYQKVYSVQQPNQPGMYPHSVTFTLPADATAIVVRLYVGSNISGDEVWWDDFLVVEGTYTGGYFDGSTPPRVHRNITLNPRGVAGGTAWAGPGGMPVPSSEHPAGSTTLETTGGGEIATYVRQTGTPSSTIAGTALTFARGIPSLPNQAYSGSVMVRSSVAASVKVNIWFTDSGTPTGANDPVTLVPNVWTLVSFTNLVSKPNAIYGGDMSLVTLEGGALVGPGETLDVAHPVVVTETTVPPYFDGATPALGLGAAWEGAPDASASYLYDPAYTYAWTGTPDASTSTRSKIMETVAGVTPPASDQAEVMLTTDFPAHGAKAMRYTLLTTGPIDLPISDADLTTGTYYTIYGRVRPRTRDQAFIPRVRGASGATFTALKDNWTEFRATLAAGGASKNTTGLYLDPGSDYEVGDIVDIDSVVVTQGAYIGPYFDGSTADGGTDPDLSYAWTGSANASTSIVSALDVANVAFPPADQAKHLQTTDAPALGAHALRYVVQTAPAVGLSATNLLPDTGATYTLVGKVRPRTRDEKLAPRIRSAVGPVFTAPKDVWTPFRLTIPAGTGAVQQTGLLLASNSGHRPGDIIDIDEVLLIEGAYEGPYFDGSFPDSSESDYEIPGTKIREFSWTGEPDASTSEFRTGNVTSVEDPEAYEDKIFRMVRNLHTVTCVAGPLVIQKFHRDETWGYLVEFVIVAAVPWMYGDTRPVELAPSIPIVVQDVPFNLVPYPSAELTDGVPVVAAKNYVKNPSIEANVTDWSAGGDGTVILAATLVGERTTELKAHGSSSYRVKFTATTTATGGYFRAQTVVPLAGLPANTRFSANLWASASVESGTAVLGDLEYIIYWQDAGGTTLREDDIHTGAPAGGAYSAESLLPPAGTTQAVLRALQRMTSFSAGAVVRLYVDAAAVTVP